MSKIEIASQDHQEILEVDFCGKMIESTNDDNLVYLAVDNEESYATINLTYKQTIALTMHLQKMIQVKKEYDEQQQAKQWQEKIQQYEQLKQELSEYGYLK